MKLRNKESDQNQDEDCVDIRNTATVSSTLWNLKSNSHIFLSQSLIRAGNKAIAPLSPGPPLMTFGTFSSQPDQLDFDVSQLIRRTNYPPGGGRILTFLTHPFNYTSTAPALPVDRTVIISDRSLDVFLMYYLFRIESRPGPITKTLSFSSCSVNYLRLCTPCDAAGLTPLPTYLANVNSFPPVSSLIVPGLLSITRQTREKK